MFVVVSGKPVSCCTSVGCGHVGEVRKCSWRNYWSLAIQTADITSFEVSYLNRRFCLEWYSIIVCSPPSLYGNWVFVFCYSNNVTWLYIMSPCIAINIVPLTFLNLYKLSSTVLWLDELLSSSSLIFSHLFIFFTPRIRP